MTHSLHVIFAALVAIFMAVSIVKLLLGVAWLAFWFAIMAVKLVVFAIVAVIIFTIVYTFVRRRSRMP